MTPHVHPLLDPGLVLSLPLVVAAALAVGASRAESRRGRPWPLRRLLLGVHFLASGCLLTGALIGVDPAPHRAPFGLRVGVVLGSIAAHALLGTTLYAEAASDVERQAAQILYYGGDLLEVALVTVLFAQHYAATAPGRARKPLGGRPVHP